MIFGETWRYRNKNEKLDLLREENRGLKYQVESLSAQLEQLRSVLGYTVAQGGELLKDGMIVAAAPAR